MATSAEESNLAAAVELMKSAAKLMSSFPPGFTVSHPPLPEAEEGGYDAWLQQFKMDNILSDARLRKWLQEAVNALPAGLMPLFVNATNFISQILEMFGALETPRTPMGLSIHEMLDFKTLNLIHALGQIREDAKRSKLEDDPMGMERVLMEEIIRRRLAARMPFARTLTTMLGPDALSWLTAKSKQGVRRIQPHEFMRTGWCDLWSIEAQIEIEKELSGTPPEARHAAKSLVALSWTAAALASYFPAPVFLGERMPYLSSDREGNYTVSVGLATRTIIDFDRQVWPALVEVLADGLLEPLLTAADLMWMGLAMARVRGIESGFAAPSSPVEESFGVFLSHRGRDSKTALASAVHSLSPEHGAFLDCLTLPHGVINRSFVFGSLARSGTILVVETENFGESEWCRKEAWFAQALTTRGLARMERLNLKEALHRVRADGRHWARRRADPALGYPIAPRILKDIDYWARRPNLQGLQEQGYEGRELDGIQALHWKGHPEKPDWVKGLGRTVNETLAATFAAAPDAKPFDLWATALQYSAAAFACTSMGRSKMEVRRGIDQLNALAKSFAESDLRRDPAFLSNPAGYLALLAAASAIDMAGFRLDSRMAPAVETAVSNLAHLQDGLLLLNVCQPGPQRDFRLRLIALAVENNLGSIGIVQHAFDPVHQMRMGALPLEILPCITLYPGMEAAFSR